MSGKCLEIPSTLWGWQMPAFIWGQGKSHPSHPGSAAISNLSSTSYFMTAPESGVKPSPWNKEPEAGLSSGRIIHCVQTYPIYPTKNGSYISWMHAHACNSHNTWSSLMMKRERRSERSSAVTISCLWFTSEGLPSQLQGERSCLFSATPLLWL